jgi:hypothetical protein
VTRDRKTIKSSSDKFNIHQSDFDIIAEAHHTIVTPTIVPVPAHHTYVYNIRIIQLRCHTEYRYIYEHITSLQNKSFSVSSYSADFTKERFSTVFYDSDSRNVFQRFSASMTYY